MENTTTPPSPIAMTNNELAEQLAAPVIVIKRELPHDQLLKALYFMWDAFDRTNMPYFLVDHTAEEVLGQKDLSGDGITLGVRRMEWQSGARRILDAFITPTAEDDAHAEYSYEGVPITIHFYEDSESVVSPDTIMYRHERFKVPNPYDAFKKHYS